MGRPHPRSSAIWLAEDRFWIWIVLLLLTISSSIGGFLFSVRRPRMPILALLSTASVLSPLAASADQPFSPDGRRLYFRAPLGEHDHFNDPRKTFGLLRYDLPGEIR